MVLQATFFFFFQAEDGIRDYKVTGVQTCALPIYFGIVRHGAEFVHHKWLAKTSGTALPKNYWSFRCAPNNQRDDRHGDCHDQEKDRCANSIDDTLNQQ